MEAFSSGLLLTSSQVADLLRVHVSSIKRWTNDGEMRSSATAGGHRRIHLDDALRAASERGIATYLDAFAPYQGHVWRAVHDAEENGDFRRVQSLAMGWLAREYPQRVGDLFVELGTRGRLPFDRLLDRGIRACLDGVSEAVRQGRLRAGAERMVSQVLLEALYRIHLGVPLSTRRVATPSGPCAILGSIGNEAHGLGLMGIRVLLEREGFQVHYLGPNVPPDEFASVQRSRQAELVCVVCGSAGQASRSVETIRKLAASYDAASPYALLVALPEAPVDLSGVPSPFLALVPSDSTEGLATWVRNGMSRIRPDRKASA